MTAKSGRSDPRVARLFTALRESVDIIEDMLLHPYMQQQPAAPPPATPTAIAPRPAPLPNSLVQWKQLKDVYGVPYSRSHIYRLEEAGSFPKRVKLGIGRVAWRASDIEEWINSRPR